MADIGKPIRRIRIEPERVAPQPDPTPEPKPAEPRPVPRPVTPKR